MFHMQNFPKIMIVFISQINTSVSFKLGLTCISKEV